MNSKSRDFQKTFLTITEDFVEDRSIDVNIRNYIVSVWKKIVMKKARSKLNKYYQSISRKFDEGSWYIYGNSVNIDVYEDEFTFVDKMGRDEI